MKVVLIRHSKTAGNLMGRYIGTTDEPLCEEGIRLLENRSYPAAELVYVSPMKRCRETAALIYPTLAQREEPLLRECDFGDFENKNYLELNGNPDYQAWVDSGGTLPFPGGESREGFSGTLPGRLCEDPERSAGRKEKADRCGGSWRDSDECSFCFCGTGKAIL